MKRTSKKSTDKTHPVLFELPPRGAEDRPLPQLKHPIWTENKAKLIQRYLFLFELVTKHGTYIDGFAGPQEPDKPTMWAAKLVLDMRPPFLLHFHLCEKLKYKVKELEALKRQQPETEKGRKLSRTINVYPGDFNQNVRKILKPGEITDKAVFCLLDQHTFECHWESVRLIADYKRGEPTKIEQFYFLATSWIARSFSGVRHDQQIQDWWGRKDWHDVMKWSWNKVLDEMGWRFRDELGYKSVRAYPIYSDKSMGSRIMYHMIHATDHEAAPELMTRAYNTALKRKGTQLELESLFPVPPEVS
ncbi:MAG TPA: three-Cys-motif partner protein TcmP [Candidatus Angelobacter sp.]|jgi:three-Cys-motif partner protein